MSGSEDRAALVGYYMDQGIRLVRLDSNRLPVDTGWQDPERVNHPQALIEDHVKNGGGLGWQLGEVSGGLVVVDNDWGIARKLAPRFLPDTLRAAKGSEDPSHYVYYCEGLGFEAFNALDGSRIVDVKASNNGKGHMAAVEPTIHPNKGPYQFVGGYNPAAIETAAAGDLRRRIRLLVCSSLIAANIPASKEEGVGGRHDLALALIGYLLRNGVPTEDAEKVLTEAWGVRRAAREAVEDIRRSIPDTAERLSRDEPVKGGHKLEEAIPGMPRRIAEILGWSGRNMEEKRKSYMRTDLGNAERFVDAYGDDLRWCVEVKCWMVYDGCRWKFDDGSLTARRRAHAAVRGIFSEAEHAADDAEAKAIAKHAVASQASARIEALLLQARAYLGVSMEDLDQDIWLLNAPNGSLDLRTGELREHRREDLITKITAVPYEPDAVGSRFKKFLEEVIPDPEVRSFVQRYAGYSLTGSTSERVIAFLYGNGWNGKSTLVEAIKGAAGDYGAATTPDTILAFRNGSGIPNDVAALKGVRMAAASEPDQNRRLAESKVKNLTGNEEISARYMRGEFFDFQPQFSLWISMNHKPIITGTDEAIWDRIRLIPFTQRFEGGNTDRELPAKLAEERAGILSWMVKGALDWHESGLGNPYAVAAATREYRDEMDTLADFFDACCVIAPEATVPAAHLYKTYEAWAENAGERKDSQRTFGMRLTERGFDGFKYTSGPNKDRKGWSGIGIRADDGPPDDGVVADHNDIAEALDKHTNQENGRNSGGSSSAIADDGPLTGTSSFAGVLEGAADKADDSGPANRGHTTTHTHEEVMPKSLSASSASSAKDPVALLFADPPAWLTNQVKVYERNPSDSSEGREKRLVKPLSSAVAHKLGLSAEETRDAVRKELEGWLG